LFVPHEESYPYAMFIQYAFVVTCTVFYVCSKTSYYTPL